MTTFIMCETQLVCVKTVYQTPIFKFTIKIFQLLKFPKDELNLQPIPCDASYSTFCASKCESFC